jgi:hypothetical protein
MADGAGFLSAERGCDNGYVPAVTRLETVVDLRSDEVDSRTMSLSARHEAVLADGRRVLLLDGRGWTSTLMSMRGRDEGGSPENGADIWASTSVEEIERSARTVVGPDEPFGGHTRDEVEAGHWSYLSDVLRQQGILADAEELKQLPHHVALSQRLLARVHS